MNIKEVQSMVDMIRDADNKDLGIVSLFLLPLLLGAWSIFLNSLGFLDQRNGLKFSIICFLFVLYFFGLICMKKTDTEKEKLKRARYHIETRLKKIRGAPRASFNRIRNEVDETYSDEFQKKLIDENPELFATCKIKTREGIKPGIKLVIKDA